MQNYQLLRLYGSEALRRTAAQRRRGRRAAGLLQWNAEARRQARKGEHSGKTQDWPERVMPKRVNQQAKLRFKMATRARVTGHTEPKQAESKETASRSASKGETRSPMRAATTKTRPGWLEEQHARQMAKPRPRHKAANRRTKTLTGRWHPRKTPVGRRGRRERRKRARNHA